MKTTFIALFGICVSVASHAADPTPALTLTDRIGRNWTREVIAFDLSPEAFAAASQGKRLSSGTTEVPYQIMGEGTKISAMVDLPPYSVLALQFDEADASIKTDLRVAETAGEIQISNGLVAIAIRKNLENGQGPVAGIRGVASDIFHGGSLLTSEGGIQSYTTTVVTNGPVKAEVLCEVVIHGGKRWQIRFTARAGDPAIWISEQFDLGGESAWTLNVTSGQRDTELFYRSGMAINGKAPGLLKTSPLLAGEDASFFWEPWLHWWEKENQGKWFGVFDPKGTELAFVGSREAHLWLLPPDFADGDKTPLSSRSRPIPIRKDDSGVRIQLPLAFGQRHWMVGMLPKADSLSALATNEGYAAPLPQQSVIKSEFPLDRIKDQVLVWDHQSAHPKLFINLAELEKLKADPASANLFDIEKLLKNPPLHEDLDEWLAAYWITGDERLRAPLLALNEKLMDSAVAYYLEQGDSVTLGYAPHHNYGSVLSAVNLADTVLSFKDVPEETRKRLLAKAAFLGYVLERDDHWWPEGRFSANPNMDSMVASMRTAVGSLIPDHPRSQAWVDEGLGELLTQLHEWSDDNGGWLEAPHYALAGFDPILAATIVAANTGKANHRFDEKIKKIARWLAKIQTPPDDRFNNYRHLPSIGNTYINDRTNIFGLLGALWKDKDPEFASEMIWMHEQSGRPPTPAIGGFFPSMIGYRSMLAALAPGPKAPSYGSELFPKAGAVMRSGFPSNRETMLYVIAGDFHAHYDYDSGSVTIWAKGSILAEDFGYYGRAPMEDHNLIDSPLSDGERMKINDFTTTPNLDFFQGTDKGWTRQIIFVKDADPLGPNYFVINDALRVPAPATWRMWFDARKVSIEGNSALVEGIHDVNALVTFVRPAKVKLETEPKTRKSHGIDANLKQGQMERTLQGVIASSDRDKGFTSVIFPFLEGQTAPKVESFEEGRVVVVSGSGWKHYVFLSGKSFSWKQGSLAFDGTVGAILEANGETTLALGAAGKIQSGKRLLTSEKATRQVWKAP